MIADPAGLAALKICESVLIQMVEQRVIDRETLEILFVDALDSLDHQGDALIPEADPMTRQRAAAVLEQILAALRAAHIEPVADGRP